MEKLFRLLTEAAAAILGIAFVNNIYGDATMVTALMIVGTVPLYNIIAVIVLSVTSPEKKESSPKKILLKTLKDVIKNPIIIGIAIGLNLVCS